MKKLLKIMSLMFIANFSLVPLLAWAAECDGWHTQFKTNHTAWEVGGPNKTRCTSNKADPCLTACANMVTAVAGEKSALCPNIDRLPSGCTG